MWEFIISDPVGALKVFLFVVVFFGFCIFIHELGHFLAAKWRGLHIIAFSIGFKKIWSFKHNNIEYRIGCIPCGGYVDLPQIDATGEPKDEHGNPLPRAKPVDKIITAVAGPLFNVLFGIFLGCFVWYYGIPQDTPKMREIKVESVEHYSPEYKAGLRQGDIITSINGKSFNCTWNDFVRKIFFTVGNVTLDVRRGDKDIKVTYLPKPNPEKTPRAKIAYPFFSPRIPLKCSIVPGSPAEKGGLRNGDVILKVNGKSVVGFSELGEILMENRGEPISFTINRDGKVLEIKGVKPTVVNTGYPQIGVVLQPVCNARVADLDIPDSMRKTYNGFELGDLIVSINGKPVLSDKTLESAIKNAGGKVMKFKVMRGEKSDGIASVFPEPTEAAGKTPEMRVDYSFDKSQVMAASVLPGAAAEKAGMKDYDRIVKVDGKPVTGVKMFIQAIRASKGKELILDINREGKALTLKVKPDKSYAMNLGLQMVWVDHPTPWHQFVQVIDMTYKSLRGIYRHLTVGDSTLKFSHMSGPVGIFNAIAITFQRSGWMKALFLIVMITYSLALLNIMPLPVLDGGHIVIALIEWIRGGKPLPAKLIQPVFMVFVLFLISMMLYVTYFDIRRMTSVKKTYKFLSVPKSAAVSPSAKKNSMTSAAKTHVAGELKKKVAPDTKSE